MLLWYIIPNFIDIFSKYNYLHCFSSSVEFTRRPALREAYSAASRKDPITANAGSNSTEEGEFADRGGRVRRLRKEGLCVFWNSLPL